VRIRALTSPRAQSASLIAVGAFGVHQLRYLLTYGAGGDNDLSRQSYLGHALPLLLGIVLAAFIAGLVRSTISGHPPEAERRVKATTYAIGIVAVFFCQELMEGTLVAGHASGLAAIFSAGGWAALPLAVLFGVIAALIDRGMEAVESRLAEAPVSFDRAPLQIGLASAPTTLGRRLSPLALGLAQRPPPTLG